MLCIQNNAEPFSPPPNTKENINQIKRYIENFNFSVGVFFLWQGGLVLKLEDGREKRVPHRVYEIYQMIRGSHENLIDPSNTKEVWQKIQRHAQKALDCSRFWRDSKTTEFYRNIVNDDMILLENEMYIENKFKFK